MSWDQYHSNGHHPPHPHSLGHAHAQGQHSHLNRVVSSGSASGGSETNFDLSHSSAMGLGINHGPGAGNPSRPPSRTAGASALVGVLSRQASWNSTSEIAQGGGSFIGAQGQSQTQGGNGTRSSPHEMRPGSKGSSSIHSLHHGLSHGHLPSDGNEGLQEDGMDEYYDSLSFVQQDSDDDEDDQGDHLDPVGNAAKGQDGSLETGMRQDSNGPTLPQLHQVLRQQQQLHHGNHHHHLGVGVQSSLVTAGGLTLVPPVFGTAASGSVGGRSSNVAGQENLNGMPTSANPADLMKPMHSQQQQSQQQHPVTHAQGTIGNGLTNVGMLSNGNRSASGSVAQTLQNQQRQQQQQVQQQQQRPQEHQDQSQVRSGTTRGAVPPVSQASFQQIPLTGDRHSQSNQSSSIDLDDELLNSIHEQFSLGATGDSSGFDFEDPAMGMGIGLGMDMDMGVGLDLDMEMDMEMEMVGEDEEPLYVNAKQYGRIVKRRAARARLEELNQLIRERKVGLVVYTELSQSMNKKLIDFFP